MKAHNFSSNICACVFVFVSVYISYIYMHIYVYVCMYIWHSNKPMGMILPSFPSFKCKDMSLFPRMSMCCMLMNL